jgi:endo-1,4-beta-mannosidase
MSDSAPSQPFLLGVNYWPRRKAMFWWSQFEAAEVVDEFALIRDLGLRLVRIFLLWEDWQPTPDSVSPDALRHLETVCDIANDRGLELDVTFFTGHMSGPNWAPGWMLCRGGHPAPRVRQLVSGGRSVPGSYSNLFTDPVALRAAETLLHGVVSRFAQHPAIGLWNLGNEPDLFAWPPDAATGRAWIQRMTSLIRALDPVHPVTCGLHTANLFEDNGLRVHDVFSIVDTPVMHGYPMYVDWADGPLDPDFVPFLCALTAALCGRPALMEEFGGPTAAPGVPSSVWKWPGYGVPRQQYVPSEEAFAAYVEQVLPRLVGVGALGAVLWCFADYVPQLWDRPPCDQSWHERHFGLVRPDGSLKPHADLVQRFAASDPVVRPARRIVSLDISPDAYYQDPLAHAKRLYRAYRAA